MGVKGLLKELPGGSMDESFHGFLNLDILRNKCLPADIDTGTLVFVCALRHREAFNSGNYTPSAREFQRQMIHSSAMKYGMYQQSRAKRDVKYDMYHHSSATKYSMYQQ